MSCQLYNLQQLPQINVFFSQPQLYLGEWCRHQRFAAAGFVLVTYSFHTDYDLFSASPSTVVHNPWAPLGM